MYFAVVGMFTCLVFMRGHEITFSIIFNANSYTTIVLLRVVVLLCNGREMGGYTRAVSGQRLVKYVPLLSSRFLIMQQLDYNNGRAVISRWSLQRGYKQDEVWEVEYLHLSHASHRRQRKRNPVPGGIIGPPCSWGI
jgi:hypothetical protein